MSELPAHPDAFDPGWLARQLGAPGALRGWTATPIGTGQMCDSYRLALDWADPSAGPGSIIAKCPAADPQSRQTGQALHSYELEVRWYQTFAAQAAIRTPRCYHAAIHGNLCDFVLLLEDVAPARQGDQLAGAAPGQVEQALGEIAHLHALLWNDPRLESIGWLNYGKDARELLRAFVPDVYPRWRQRYAVRLAPEILDAGQALAAGFENYLRPRSHPRAMIHGDLRLDNILFSDAQGRAVIVDWQTVAAGGPLSDVAYCIGTSVRDPDVRAAHEERLVRGYFDRLREQGIADFTWQACWEQYRLFAFGGLIMAVVASMLVERTERGDEMFAVMAERSGRQALHLDSLALL